MTGTPEGINPTPDQGPQVDPQLGVRGNQAPQTENSSVPCDGCQSTDGHAEGCPRSRGFLHQVRSTK